MQTLYPSLKFIIQMNYDFFFFGGGEIYKNKKYIPVPYIIATGHSKI